MTDVFDVNSPSEKKNKKKRVVENLIKATAVIGKVKELTVVGLAVSVVSDLWDLFAPKKKKSKMSATAKKILGE